MIQLKLLSETVNKNKLVDNIERLVSANETKIDKGFLLHIVHEDINFFVTIDKEITFQELVNILKREVKEIELENIAIHTIPPKDDRFVWEQNTCLQNKISEFI